MRSNIKNWNDLKAMIAALSVTALIGFWNLFSGADSAAGTLQAEPEQAASPVTLLEQPSSAAQPPGIINGKLLLGGPPPSSVNPSLRQRNNLGNQPITQTRSS